jgi:hypothetical protein
VLIDATIVRALLVPSLMVLLGRWNWAGPGWLQRWHRRFGTELPADLRHRSAVPARMPRRWSAHRFRPAGRHRAAPDGGVPAAGTAAVTPGVPHPSSIAAPPPVPDDRFPDRVGAPS